MLVDDIGLHSNSLSTIIAIKTTVTHSVQCRSSQILDWSTLEASLFCPLLSTPRQNLTINESLYTHPSRTWTFWKLVKSLFPHFKADFTQIRRIIAAHYWNPFQSAICGCEIYRKVSFVTSFPPLADCELTTWVICWLTFLNFIYQIWHFWQYLWL